MTGKTKSYTIIPKQIAWFMSISVFLLSIVNFGIYLASLKKIKKNQTHLANNIRFTLSSFIFILHVIIVFNIYYYLNISTLYYYFIFPSVLCILIVYTVVSFTNNILPSTGILMEIMMIVYSVENFIILYLGEYQDYDWYMNLNSDEQFLFTEK